MNQSEREDYRQRHPHIAPEISKGFTQSIKSDIFSFGHLLCTTLKVVGEKEKSLLKLGQELTKWNPEKRLDLQATKGRILAVASSGVKQS